MNNILIVEDDNAISELLSMNLTVAGFSCEVANDGQQALSFINEATYDLALLDIMLPELDGFALFEHMKKNNIPVIYISAKNDTASKIKGLKIGAEDYITKPFDVLELIVRVEKVLARRFTVQEIFKLDNVHINEKEHTVHINEFEIEFKPMEFSLLLMLVKHPNMVFSREQLLREVWGDEYFGETRTVDNHIALLRKKLNWNDKIVTVHRVGYRLEVK